MFQKPSVAFVQDALPYQGGAEKVLEAALEVFPDAPIYTLVYNRKKFTGTTIAEKTIHTSFLNRLPGAQNHHHNFLPLMPLAIEQFDLGMYDVIVSFSYAVAHGIVPQPGQLHISYMHTPLRYAWQNRQAFLTGRGWLSRLVAATIMHSFRTWDYSAAARVDHFVTVSEWMADCIWRAYRREAEVLYPPVDINLYQPRTYRKDYYVTVSRLVSRKRIDLIVEAFNQLGLPLMIIGEGPERSRLQKMSNANIVFLGWQSQDRVAEILAEAKAFIHASEEDFGIAIVEAQAAGCPVIALNRGAPREIVQAGITGEFFERQESRELVRVVLEFEKHAQHYDPNLIHRQAERFDRSHFINGFYRIIDEGWSWFQQRHMKLGPGADSLWMPVEKTKVDEHEG